MERTYTIPLRREWLKKAKYVRAKKAVTAIKEFMVKHMKAEELKIGPLLNQALWKNGIKNPPHKIKVTAIKDDKGLVKVELFGHKYVGKKKEKKEEKQLNPLEKIKNLAGGGESRAARIKREKEEALEDAKAEEVKDALGGDKKPSEVKESPKTETKPAEKKVETKPATTKAPEKQAVKSEAKAVPKKDSPKPIKKD